MLTAMEAGFPIRGSVARRLLDAALEAFEAHGYDGAAVADIARAAEVTTGALYHHFRSKAGLHAALLEDLEKRLAERLEGALEAGDGGREAMVRGLCSALAAAVRMGCCRVVGERALSGPDPIAAALGGVRWGASVAVDHAAAVAAAAAWRAVLLVVADGLDPVAGQQALRAALGVQQKGG